jgi:hypothetical protein
MEATMMKRLIALSAFALIATTSSVSLAETSWGVSINLGNAPPPPVVVVREEPHVVFVPSSSVYVVSDRRWNYDTFRYGVYWYAYRDNYWYRARSWRGPYAVVAANRIPRAIINVPSRHWKHHPHGMPPGQARKYDRDRDVYVEHERRVYVKDNDHGNGHKGGGKGKGHK